MGQMYHNVGPYVSATGPQDIVLEIGSDRYEGSSYYFADLAGQHDMGFVTVDIDPEAVARARKNVPDAWMLFSEFVCAEATSWTGEFGKRSQKIKVLYLDNFDWDWDIADRNEHILQQQKWYAKNGISMTNINCQASHLVQMINLLPYMSDQCVVCVDDTYEHNGVFIGKGGAVVPYLVSQDFGILQARDYGVILGRGYRNYIV